MVDITKNSKSTCFTSVKKSLLKCEIILNRSRVSIKKSMTFDKNKGGLSLIFILKEILTNNKKQVRCDNVLSDIQAMFFYDVGSCCHHNYNHNQFCYYCTIYSPTCNKYKINQ